MSNKRPQINIELNGDKHPVEAFMHGILRPILKQQHSILVECLEAEKNVNTALLNGSNQKLKQEYLTTLIKKNMALKNRIIGLVIGQFNTDERTIYWTMEKEINRRIVEMATTRLLSVFQP